MEFIFYESAIILKPPWLVLVHKETLYLAFLFKV